MPGHSYIWHYGNLKKNCQIKAFLLIALRRVPSYLCITLPPGRSPTFRTAKGFQLQFSPLPYHSHPPGLLENSTIAILSLKITITWSIFRVPPKFFFLRDH